MLLLLLKMLLVTYLCVVGVMQAAPAARVGYSWASNNLRLLQSYLTKCCLVLACANLLLGQAQLVARGVRNFAPSVDCGPPAGTLQQMASTAGIMLLRKLPGICPSHSRNASTRRNQLPTACLRLLTFHRIQPMPRIRRWT